MLISFFGVFILKYEYLIIGIFFIILSYFFVDKEVALFFHYNIVNSTKNLIEIVTTLGQAEYFLIPSFVLFIFFYKKDKFIKKGSLFIFYSVALSGILVNIIKFIVARYRPPAFFESGLYGFKGFDFGFLVNSFPSGHTTTAFSGFIGLAFLFPKYKYFFLFFAIIIGISRILLAVHYVSDVIAGAILGTLTTYFLYKKMFKEKDEDRL